LEEQTKYQERSMSAKELELSLANQKLRELDEVRNRFISVTTHEMRTPLAGIKWTFSMLDSGQLGDLGAEAKGFIHKGAESVDHLIKIINDLLSVNKVDATSEELKLEKVAPVDLISDVVREFATQAVSRKISLNFVKPDWGVPLLDADRAKLRVVLENLIDNGLKYGRAGGQVTIMIIGDGLNTAEPKLEVTVTDSGIGINPADQGKIFHKFYRGASAVAVEPDGSGVGLYICRDLVEKHRGTIWFENRPGGGTVFHFTLPVSQKKV
jgi:signal transduction histidine kinase